MKLLLKNLPTGTLPYEKIDLATNMMVKLFEQSPFLAMLPNINSEDNLINLTLNDKYFKILGKNVLFNIDLDNINEIISSMEKTYKNPIESNLDEFSIKSAFFDRYLKILKRIQPKETIVTFMGPFSSLSLVSNIDKAYLLTNKYTRKFTILYFSLKVLFVINKIKTISPETNVIVLYDEPLLKDFSKLKLAIENIDNDTITAIYKKIFKKVHEFGGITGIQCFGKCNWSIPIDANANLISFDGYHNPNNLNIIASKINEFLAKGGYINWGFIPLYNERQIKTLNADKLFNKFIKTTEGLIADGVSADLLYSHSLISTLGDMADLPVIFAEKAILIANQLSKKISTLK